jgi:lipopolysaccharide/colanic/teichoic acid biosynthesis glycosyltransferase
MTGARPAMRVVDVAVAGALLAVTAPLLGVLALAVRLTSPGPAFFRQTRVGRDGRPFRLLKLRTMTARAAGPSITAADDGCITPLGRWLRRWKLDELPQLVHVLTGTMSLVGPRPEVPEYLAALGAAAREYTAVRPGLADPATLRYYDEAELLAGAADPERRYVEVILPDKVRLSCAYTRERTLASDLRVLWAVVRRVLGVAPVLGSRHA